MSLDSLGQSRITEGNVLTKDKDCMLAFVFPGQGSQVVGMGRALWSASATARHVFEEVDDALGVRLSAIMFDGPMDLLTRTDHAQPALMAVSLAVLRVLEQEGGFDTARKVAYMAGHSLGEYAAHGAARSLTLADCARLLRVRGRAMLDASPDGVGAMAALLGCEMDMAEQLVRTWAGDQILGIANDNGGGQIVVSGHREAILRLEKAALDAGVRRCVVLPVGGAFHSALMAPAAAVMADALGNATMGTPLCPIVANCTAQPETDPTRLKTLLVDQVTGRVRWRETILTMQQCGVTHVVEMGSGQVLSGLTRRIAPDMQVMSVSEPDHIDRFLGATFP